MRGERGLCDRPPVTQRPSLKVVYLSSESFMNELIGPCESSLLHDEAEDENHGCGEDIVATVRVVFGPQHTDIFVLNRFHFAICPSRLSHPILAHVNLLLPMKNARRQLLDVILFVFNKVCVNRQCDHRIARASSNAAGGPQSTQ
jgi:hypothetical protein